MALNTPSLTNKPPENIPPNELFLKLSAMPRAHRTVDLPRLDPMTGEPVGQIIMQVLTQAEQMRTLAAAETVTRKMLKDAMPGEGEAKQGYTDLFRNAAAVEVLYAVCRDAKDITRPFFPGPAEMRKTLTTDELGVLMSNYLTVQTELGPIKAELSAEESEAWLHLLVRGGSTLPLDSLSWDALKSLVLFLARLVETLRTAISSAGKPLESGSDSGPTPSPDDGDLAAEGPSDATDVTPHDAA
jgi:hypothetical protein